MRAAHSLRMLGLLLVAATPNFALGQSSFPPQTTGVDATAPGEAESPSPWSWIRKPKLTMPKLEFPKMPADPLAPVKASARKVSDGTKRAWEGTKELFTFGGKKAATTQPTERLASNPEQPSVWKRMFGGAEEEPQGPQTVADWMAQPRPE